MTVFMQKGDAYLSVAQAYNRGLAIYNLEMAVHQRTALQVSDPTYYEAWAMNWIHDNQISETNNVFNLDLLRYRRATLRLEKYELAVGREEVYYQQDTGEIDDEGVAVTELILGQTAIEALPATVEIAIYSDDGTTTVEQVANPAIVIDESERSRAQASIDATPDEVKNF